MITGYYRTSSSVQSHCHAIISSIARHAVVYDKVVEASDVHFKVEAGGNVVVVEPEKREQTARRAPGKLASHTKQERRIVVPRQVAYERIVEATREKIEQLEKLAVQSSTGARRWSQACLLITVIAAVNITITVLAILLPGFAARSLLLMLVITSLLCLGLVCLFFWRARVKGMQTDFYYSNLQLIEKFYKIQKASVELDLDETTRSLLQEIIIARALGLTNEQAKEETAEQLLTAQD
ncbi:hypothetical protein EPA93_22085 [Ktedonosporobacter rubrisoli]|uniref:DUF4231 domain-containing protein n=1 Tax=Ktedonosporobacter rubrisoli TaxID=2509675 RepID=A0A4P6JSL9_KTERU|nr:hypothetical protein [Ktedonosporobacter rubrisoli]QBD78537.1 hypothetical protein EPA93_22085 [Ktedonosporobacter rubrisoli]